MAHLFNPQPGWGLPSARCACLGEPPSGFTEGMLGELTQPFLAPTRGWLWCAHTDRLPLEAVNTPRDAGGDRRKVNDHTALHHDGTRSAGL